MRKKATSQEVAVVDKNDLLTFDIFVKRAMEQALAHTTKKVRNHHLAEDLLFEALIRLHRGWPETDRKHFGHGFNLLKRAIGWCITDHVRKDKNEQSIEELSETGFEVVAPSTNDNSENKIILFDILSRLEEEDRMILTLDAEGLTNEEIAHYVDMSIPGLKSRLDRLRNRIQEKYFSGTTIDTYKVSLLPTSSKKMVDDGENWYTVASLAMILRKTTPWILLRLKAIDSIFVVRKTIGVYYWPHVPEITLRRLREVAMLEDYSFQTSSVINGLKHKEDSWLTSRQMSSRLGHDEQWVIRRLTPFLIQAEYREARNGNICLYYPPSVVRVLRVESKSSIPGNDWLTVGRMAEITGRHSLWVNLRLPTLGKKLKIKPERRTDSTGAQTEHWPPIILRHLLVEVDQFPNKGNWVSIGELSASLGKDWSWIQKHVLSIGIEPKQLRIPGSGKVFPHYPPIVGELLEKIANELKPAPKGWYTKRGLKNLLGKSSNWVRVRVSNLCNPEIAIHGDVHMVPRTFYGPRTVAFLKKESIKAKSAPSQGSYLSIRQIAILIGKSPGWTKKQIKSQKIRGSFRRDDQGRIRRFYNPNVVKRIRLLIPN